MANLPTIGLGGQRGLAADATSLNALNTLAAKDGKAAIKESARQFEALFMKELLKSMRDATMKSGLMDNGGSDLGTDLLDQQWALQMTGLPGGLSEMIERQLSQQMGGATPKTPPVSAAPSAASGTGGVVPKPTETQAAFVSKHAQAATAVAQESGIPAAFMIGQAAHETGWGRSQIRNPDGSESFNLFGIKAGANWKGPVTEITTTEYVDGQARKVSAKFRAYSSYQESFRDYARLIGNSPRYAKVMDNLQSAQSFAAGLQDAGYATDPRYADKLSKTINTTLQLQRARA
ncbi:MAG: hypothetical protein RJA09_244 [Pseudomonadota bacterium]|jgi:flagellar protein FlgJ